MEWVCLFGEGSPQVPKTGDAGPESLPGLRPWARSATQPHAHARGAVEAAAGEPLWGPVGVRPLRCPRVSRVRT